jgi:hypothetical protein
MPRQAGLDAPGALHHVMIRGIEGTAIFRNGEDREVPGGGKEDGMRCCESDAIFGVTTSTVNRIAGRDEIDDLERYVH